MRNDGENQGRLQTRTLQGNCKQLVFLCSQQPAMVVSNTCTGNKIPVWHPDPTANVHCKRSSKHYNLNHQHGHSNNAGLDYHVSSSRMVLPPSPFFAMRVDWLGDMESWISIFGVVATIGLHPRWMLGFKTWCSCWCVVDLNISNITQGFCFESAFVSVLDEATVFEPMLMVWIDQEHKHQQRTTCQPHPCICIGKKSNRAINHHALHSNTSRLAKKVPPACWKQIDESRCDVYNNNG